VFAEHLNKFIIRFRDAARMHSTVGLCELIEVLYNYVLGSLQFYGIEID